jgi:predicted DNA-binding mobile mystery protein A
MNNQRLILKQLDRQLHDWQILSEKYTRPREGWVKTLRKALGMTMQQLADRLHVSRSRVAQLEDSEQRQAITLRTLEKVAEAMDCKLVYALIPKKTLEGKTLEDLLKIKANEIAEKIIAHVGHSMSLEKQSIEQKQQKEQKEALTKKLLEGPLKKLWGNKQ